MHVAGTGHIKDFVFNRDRPAKGLGFEQRGVLAVQSGSSWAAPCPDSGAAFFTSGSMQQGKHMPTMETLAPFIVKWRFLFPNGLRMKILLAKQHVTKSFLDCWSCLRGLHQNG